MIIVIREIVHQLDIAVAICNLRTYPRAPIVVKLNPFGSILLERENIRVFFRLIGDVVRCADVRLSEWFIERFNKRSIERFIERGVLSYRQNTNMFC